MPDRNTRRGRTEYAMLLFLYNTGAQVSEATQLSVGDVQVGCHDGRHALATLRGKGAKSRQCPLWPRTERALAELLHDRAASDAVFLSRYRKPSPGSAFTASFSGVRLACRRWTGGKSRPMC